MKWLYERISNMDCPKCKTEMKKAVISAAVGGVLSVMNGEKKLLDGNRCCGVDCFGCPECGYIELYAQNSKVFKDK